jgi:hypothetical protein
MTRYVFRAAWYVGLIGLSAVAFYFGLGSPVISASVLLTAAGYLPISITFCVLWRSRLARWIAGGRVHTPPSFLRYLPGLALIAVGVFLIGVELSSLTVASLGIAIGFGIMDALLTWYEERNEPLDVKSAAR